MKSNKPKWSARIIAIVLALVTVAGIILPVLNH